MKDIVSMIFDNALTTLERNEVNNYIYSLIPDIEEKLIAPNLSDLFDVETSPISFELNFNIDNETYNCILNLIVSAFPRNLFRNTNSWDGLRKFYQKTVTPIFTENENEVSSDNLISESKIKLDRFKNIPTGYESFVHGEFNNQFDMNDIVSSDKGIFHEVVVLEDGSAVGRGSNVSCQLDFDKSSTDYVDVKCGRFFTALLKKDGTVDVHGLTLDYFMNMNPHKIGELLNWYYIGDSFLDDYGPDKYYPRNLRFVDMPHEEFDGFTDNKIQILSTNGEVVREYGEVSLNTIFMGTFFKNFSMYRQMIESEYTYKFMPDYVWERMTTHKFTTKLNHIASIEVIDDALFAIDKEGNKLTLLDEDKFFNSYTEYCDENSDTNFS